MVADLLANLKILRFGARDADQLDPKHRESLTQLGLIEMSRGAWGQVKAKLTDAGRQKLQQIDMTSVTPSPVGAHGTAQISDTGLLSLHGLQKGEPPNDMASTALAQLGLVTEDHGICVLTRKGHDLLASRWAQERLAAILSPFRRG